MMPSHQELVRNAHPPTPLRPPESETGGGARHLCLPRPAGDAGAKGGIGVPLSHLVRVGRSSGIGCMGMPTLPPASGSRFWDSRDQMLPEWREGARNCVSPDPALQSLRSAVQCGWR